MRLLLIVAMSLGYLAPGFAAEPGKPLQSQESLSEKLDKNKGVIKPPSHVDPEITVPAPETPNAMPVIPPPTPNAK
jgi:hypothetical protein